ncbi:hypothetical protein ACFLSJ_08320, partial [Verrucomicrobiota bacterium]
RWDVRTLVLGARWTEAHLGFVGDLDEVSVFDRCLSEAEIVVLMQQGLAGMSSQGWKEAIGRATEQIRSRERNSEHEGSTDPRVQAADVDGRQTIDATHLLDRLGHQLRLVVVGDSRAGRGVDPWYFSIEGNQECPRAVNVALPTTGVTRFRKLADAYLLHLPELDWVVYGVSPRVFNRYWTKTVAAGVRGSYRHEDNKAPVQAADIGGELDPWGFQNPHITGGRVGPQTEEKLRKMTQHTRYEFAQDRFDLLESTVADLTARGVGVLAFTPPWHSVMKGLPATDDDGTPREAYDDVVGRLEGLESKYNGFFFVDINRKGENDFTDEHFSNPDHLAREGAKKLTEMLDAIIKKHEEGTGAARSVPPDSQE